MNSIEFYNGSLPDISAVGANGVHVLTVQEQLSFIAPQYMGHIMKASVILLIYSLYNFFVVMPRIKERTWKNIISFHFNTVAVVMSLYLFIISLVYQGWIDI